MTNITEDASPVPEQLVSALRAFLLVLAGYLAGKGWVDSNIATATVPVIMFGVPFIWNQRKIRRRYKP